MSFSNIFLWETIVTAFVLLAAGVDDLRSRKIHNNLILFLIPIVLIAVVFMKGIQGLLPAFAGMLTAALIALPLNLGKVIGGGDLKLLMVFGLTLNAQGVIFSFFYALPWALLMGVIKMALDKNLKGFAFNLFFMAKMKKPDTQNLHTVPFSIALIFGWLTFIFTLRNWNLF